MLWFVFCSCLLLFVFSLVVRQFLFELVRLIPLTGFTRGWNACARRDMQLIKMVRLPLIVGLLFRRFSTRMNHVQRTCVHVIVVLVDG